MRKAIGLALAAVLSMSLLVGCSEDKGGTATPTVAPTTAPTTAPTEAPTPEATATPTPEPTPEIDPNVIIIADFDSDSTGVLIQLSNFPDMVGADTTPMFFSSMGNGVGEFAEGKGVDGSNCMVVTGRSSDWHGISLAVGREYFGKGFKVSYDAMFLSEEVTEATISLTSKFMTQKEDGTTSTHYPGYNRAADYSVTAGEWTHIEGTIYFPTDVYFDENDGATSAVVYFELPQTSDDFYLDNISITVVDGVGDFATMESMSAEIEEANKNE